MIAWEELSQHVELQFDDEVRRTYSRDESLLGEYPPHCVAFPTSAEQVQRVFKFCDQHNVPVTAVGGRSGKSGGALPINGGVSLSFVKLNRIVDVQPDNMIAIVEPGVILADLKRAVDTHGLMYPPDPNSAELCTLGGNIAENAGGPSAVKYGVTRDYILGLDWVLPTGELLTVGRQTLKGVAGYDLVGLFVGSEGTLGVATKIVVKLLPRPYSLATALFSFRSVEDAALAVSAILQSGLLPRCLELLDDVALKAVAGLNLPLPIGADACLLVEADGFNDESVLAELVRMSDVARDGGAIDTVVAQGAVQRERLWSVRRQVSVALRQLQQMKISEDVVVPRSKIAQAIARFKSIGSELGLTVSTYGHAGDGNLHTNVLFSNESQRSIVDEAIVRILKATVEMGGTITGEHGVGLAKMNFLEFEQSPALIDLQRRLKVLIDPRGISNPGKMFPKAHESR